MKAWRPEVSTSRFQAPSLSRATIAARDAPKGIDRAGRAKGIAALVYTWTSAARP